MSMGTLIPNLRVLNLAQCQGIGPAALIKTLRFLEQLEGLDLSGMLATTDAVLMAIRPRYLRTLCLSSCLNATPNGFVAVLGHAHRLEEFSAGCGLMDNRALITMSLNCPNLHSLSVPSCENVTDAGVVQLAGRLRKANLSCCGITDVSLRAFSSSLEYLDISEADVTDVGLCSLTINCPSLRTLEADDCSRLSDRSLLALATYCPQLRECTLTHSPKVTDTGVLALLKSCIKLEKLSVDDCQGVTGAILEAALPGIQRVDVWDCRGIQPVDCVLVARRCLGLRVNSFWMWRRTLFLEGMVRREREGWGVPHRASCAIL